MSSVNPVSSLPNGHLSDLLHYDSEKKTKPAELRKAIEEFGYLISLLREATQVFEKRDFERFDALVGENACQIRAVKIAVIASRSLININNLYERIEQARQKLSEQELPEKIKHCPSFKGLLEQGVDIELTPDEMYMLQAFILTEAKAPATADTVFDSLSIKDKSFPKKLQRPNFEMSAHFLNSMANKARGYLAEASVQYVREMALVSNDASSIEMTSEKFTIEHNTWPCIPMFWTYKVLLKTLYAESIPLVIQVKFLQKNDNTYKIIDDEKLFFRPTETGNGELFSYDQPTESDLDTPSCVVEGVMCIDEGVPFCKNKWRENFLKTTVVNAIQAGAADHRQYPDEKKHISVQDFEYENYKNMAKDQGFSIGNPTTFFINHVFSKQVKKIFQK